MSKKPTKNNRYKRITCEDYCKFEEYIAEWLIIRWTDEFKMDKPPNEFWNIPSKYQEMYDRNMRAAKSLKKKYDEALIFAAIRSKHFNKIYHIGLKCYGPRGWKYNQLAIEAIKRYNKEFKQALKLAEKQPSDNEVEKEDRPSVRRSKSFTKNKSMINKLRDL
jgi:hypothetical protein